MKNLNTTEKKLKFHCSYCQTTWQLLVIRNDLLTNENTKCLNNCSNKWEALLIAYCRERQIIHFANQEQEKDERQSLAGDQKQQDLANWIEKIRKQNQK